MPAISNPLGNPTLGKGTGRRIGIPVTCCKACSGRVSRLSSPRNDVRQVFFEIMEGSGSTMSLLKVSEVARRLNCSPSLVYDHIASGRMRCHRIGKGHGGVRISEEQLADFLKGTESNPPLPAPCPPTKLRTPLKLKHINLSPS